jgi:nitroimidazol reductase NimA-like FMN-containing flavoprotein (pyridoxamine 5'-phosphate oxidase superfamily)
MASLSDPEVRDFLTRGTRTGKLGYLAASGRPLVTPVWFIVDGDSLVSTGAKNGEGPRAGVTRGHPCSTWRSRRSRSSRSKA